MVFLVLPCCEQNWNETFFCGCNHVLSINQEVYRIPKKSQVEKETNGMSGILLYDHIVCYVFFLIKNYFDHCNCNVCL